MIAWLARLLCQRGRHQWETNPKFDNGIMFGWRRCYRCSAWQRIRIAERTESWWEYAEPAVVEEARDNR